MKYFILGMKVKHGNHINLSLLYNLFYYKKFIFMKQNIFNFRYKTLFQTIYKLKIEYFMKYIYNKI